jgi:hypothetical protein
MLPEAAQLKGALRQSRRRRLWLLRSHEAVERPP